jgi:hypothetical protein
LVPALPASALWARKAGTEGRLEIYPTLSKPILPNLISKKVFYSFFEIKKEINLK